MSPDLPAKLQRSLERWTSLWRTPELVHRATIEWSPRLTRSLGRCYPERRLVRLASYLRDEEPAILEEVLCHELAHLAVRELHSRRTKPHGPEWRSLMEAAGFEPAVRLPSPNGAPSPDRARRRFLYVHRCPVCQRARTAKRPMRRWRCADCVAAGLEGVLDIVRRLPRNR